MEEAREMIIKRNYEVAREYETRESEGKQELLLLHDELDRFNVRN